MSQVVRYRRWPWLGPALFVALFVAAIPLILSNGTGVLDDLPFVLAFGMFGVVGALIMSRQPGNRIGALLLYASLVTVLAVSSGELMSHLALRGVDEGFVVVAAGVLSTVGWLVGILPVILFLPLLFPDGRLPSPRWRPVPVLTLGLLAFLAIGFVFGERRLTGALESTSVENPLFIPGISRIDLPDAVMTMVVFAAMGASVAGLVVRYRRSTGVQRQQVRWVAVAFLFLLIAFVLSEVTLALGLDSVWIDVALTAPAFLAVPVSIGIAVLQYRLYELDVVVKKALVSGSLVVLGIVVYAGAVWAVGAIASDRAGSATLFGVALLLGMAFRPALRLARKVADRLVYGRRATPYEVLTEFSERVGDAYATDDVLGRMARILGEGIGSLGARVWLHVGVELRPASSWPDDAAAAMPVEIKGDVLPDLPGEYAAEVRDRGEFLGALSVTMPPNDPMTPAREKLVRDLASQAGLVLRNVRLVEELRASQRRIVAAQDVERRRIERNIHDGAQQQLVALTVRMRLAQGLATKEGSKTAEMLEEMQAETQSALEDLRDLARGIYPPLLADKGLAAALEAQARKSPVPVQLAPDGVGRYAAEVEAAAYFSVLEALQNVAKYAGATRASVRLDERDGWLTFEVEDDGRGFDPTTTGYGTGLQGIADRLSALGGELAVDSESGRGTRIVGRLAVSRAVPEGGGD